VPFFVKQPGQSRGRVIDRPTCVSEILPIIARGLGIELPWDSPECNRTEIAIDNGTGPVITAPIPTVLEQRDEYVATLAGLFGDDTGWSEVLKLGPNRELIGRPAGSLPSAPADGVTANPDVDGRLGRTFTPGTALNPVLRQRGVISGGEGDLPLAVSVNGTIAAVGQTYEEGENVRYSILLPEEALHEGPNGIVLYLVGEGPDGAPRLSPIG